MNDPKVKQAKSKPEKKVKKKKKSDPFWPIVIILSILAFTGSFWFFYVLTNKINTKTFPTTETPKWTQPSPSSDVLESASPIMVGGGEPTPTPEPILIATPTPEATVQATATPQVLSTPVTPSSTPKPIPTTQSTPRPVTTSRPESPPVPKPTEAPVKQIAYRVQVGSYATAADAQKVLSELSALGYQPEVVEESGKYKLRLGVFEEQDNALTLAEEITQRGYAVVVRKIER